MSVRISAYLLYMPRLFDVELCEIRHDSPIRKLNKIDAAAESHAPDRDSIEIWGQDQSGHAIKLFQAPQKNSFTFHF